MGGGRQRKRQESGKIVEDLVPFFILLTSQINFIGLTDLSCICLIVSL